MVSSFFQASVGTFWSSWMGEVVPPERRGRYFGSRAGIVGIVGMVTSLAAGWFLDKVAAPLNFQLVLGFGVLVALLGIALLPFHYEPPSKKHRHSFRETFILPWRDRNFRRFLRFGIYWQAVVLLAGPFVLPYFLEHLKMSFTQVAIWSSIAAITALFTTNLWGRVADRYGNKAVLQIGCVLVGILLPLAWMSATPGNLWPIWLAGAFDAIAWGAVGPAIFNLALASAPANDRLPYIATFSLVTGLAGFLGGVLSGPLFLLFQATQMTIGNYQWTPYHTLFALSGLLRMMGWIFVRPVEETHAWRARDVLRQVRFGWRGLGFPWRG
jgi:MFS family permease